MTEITRIDNIQSGAIYRILAEMVLRGEPVAGMNQSYVSRALYAYADIQDALTQNYEVELRPIDGRILCEVWDSSRRPHPMRRGSFFGANVSVAIRGAVAAVIPTQEAPGHGERAQGPSHSNSLL